MANDLLVHQQPDACEVRGWAFVPQEGNTILSTLDTFMLQTAHPGRSAIRAELIGSLMRRTW